MFRALVTTLFRVLICIALLAMLWAMGFAWFVTQVPHEPSHDKLNTDAIVVLTGGKGRIDYGLKLLAEGRASRLFISGVEDGITPDGLIAHHKTTLADFTISGGNDVIMLGYDARNTIGNAMETAQFMQNEHLNSLRLVTASYHMPRALREFRFLMPGVVIVPDPVIPPDFNVSNWWTLDASSHILLTEYHKLIAAGLRHWLLHITGEGA